MNKQEFIKTLRNKLSKFPQKEVENGINFYSEIIDDKIEDGILEENAVKQVGNVDYIASLIASDIPLTKIVKNNVKRKNSFRTWEIVLLVLGSPIWLSLLISLFAVVFSVYVSLWAGVISLWAGSLSAFIVSLYGIVYGIIMTFVSDVYVNLAILGLSIASVGVSILLYYCSKYSTKGLIILGKQIVLLIKNSFVKKENK